MIEVERKWLAELGPSWTGTMPVSVIAQAYLNFDPEVRVRRLDDAFYALTLKLPHAHGSRFEFPWPLSKHDGAELYARAEHQVVKRRYLDVGGWEIDVYGGMLTGLVVVELEAPLDVPLPPAPVGVRLGREVTGDVRYANASLARFGWPT